MRKTTIRDPRFLPDRGALARRHHGAVAAVDAHFEHVAKVTGQTVEWVVPRGTVP